MDLHGYFQTLFGYNAWANGRVLEAASRLSAEQLFQPQGHSFGSVHGVLVHMLGAEWIWLRRCQGDSPEALPGAADLPALADVRRRWQEQQQELLAWLDGLNEADLQRAVVYHNTRGETHSLLLWQILAHMANHATHHRGELAAMFSLMGIPHEEEDLLIYLLQNE